MIKYIVYCTTNIINKKIYIGVHEITSNKFDGYIGDGVYATRPSTYNKPKYAFQYAVKKYGPSNFKRITIKEFDNEEEAYFFEEQIVNKEFLKRKDVYNEALGGRRGNFALIDIPCYQYDIDGNFIAEYESQQKASLAVNRGFTTIKRAVKEKIKAANCFWSIEKVEKLDLTEYKTDDNRIPVFQYSETGEYDCCYESISDAARVIGSSTSNISRGCKLGYKVKGKYFSYEFNTQYSRARFESLKNRTVYQYSLSGEYLNEYKSCADAERAIKKSRGLSNAIKRGITFGGFQWKLEKFDKIDSVEVKSSARKVGQYDLEGNLIKIYNTVTACTKDFPGCRHVLQGKYKTSGGYIFKYIE